ncbi:hypothetical protein CF017_12255 [Citrobacter braakii]|nr:hypothetical protein CF017_12255 [Citrobacter braakii]
MKRGQSLPFFAPVGDDLDQSLWRAFIYCITNQNNRNFIHSKYNYFSLYPAVFFIFLYSQRKNSIFKTPKL